MSASQSQSQSKTHNEYSKHKFYDSLFDGMHQYMFSAENLLRLRGESLADQSAQASSKEMRKKKVNPSETKRKPNTFLPRQHDTLFWCFYIVKHGFDEYNLCKTTPFKTEKEFKIASVSLVRENAGKLKGMKLKLAQIENELANEAKITLAGLRALALIYGVSIFYVSGSTYFEFECANEDDAPRGIIIHDKTNNKMSVRYHGEDTEDYKKKIRTSHFCITNPEKPMNAMSGYTLPALQDICKKLSVPTVRPDGKNETKKTLYESILNAL